MYYLINSAVITAFGEYTYTQISIQEMKHFLFTYKPLSTIGYQETAQAIKSLTGYDCEVNRKQIQMKTGDFALVFRLTKRFADPFQKGSVPIEFILNNCEIGILHKQ